MSPSSSPAAEAPREHRYWSVDSAPARLTQPLSIWAAPAVLMLFTGISTLLLLVVNAAPELVAAFPNHDIVFSPYAGTHSIPLRIFIVSFYVAFALVVGAGALARTKFLGELIVTYVLLCGAFDLVNILAYRWFGLVYSLDVVEILSGLIGFFVFSLKLLDHGSMPERAAVPKRRLPRRAGSFGWRSRSAAPSACRSRSIGSTCRWWRTCAAWRCWAARGRACSCSCRHCSSSSMSGARCRHCSGRRDPSRRPVTVIVPAHNEAHVIGSTLAAIDRAAAKYDGRVTIIVINNNSSDDTAPVAGRAVTGLARATGRVVDVPTPGKAIALNRGVAEVETEFMIRIDADTQVLPDAIARAMRHFSDAATGVVGGVPLPPGIGPFDRSRLLEVLLKHGYYQVAHGAVDGIVGVPGMFAAYRTEAVRYAGGFVQGMNGEDTDVSLRIGEMGYRIVGGATHRTGRARGAARRPGSDGGFRGAGKRPRQGAAVPARVCLVPDRASLPDAGIRAQHRLRARVAGGHSVKLRAPA